MVRLFIASALVLAALLSAHAQQQQPQQVFTLQISEPDLNVIGQALGKMPYEMSAGVIARLQQQVNAQMEAEKKAADPKSKKK